VEERGRSKAQDFTWLSTRQSTEWVP
jgi:hypothetical protein